MPPRTRHHHRPRASAHGPSIRAAAGRHNLPIPLASRRLLRSAPWPRRKPAMSEPLQASGPELSKGIELAEIADGGMLTAQVNGEPVVAVRRGEEVFVLAATCGHYGAPLWDGIVVGTELRCPWHHARFDVRTGEAVGPPSPRGLPTWLVVREGSRVRAGARRDPMAPRAVRNTPASVLIVGAG